MSIADIEALLDEAEFRAINTITDLIEDHEIIVGKKIHMWGNGL